MSQVNLPVSNTAANQIGDEYYQALSQFGKTSVPATPVVPLPGLGGQGYTQPQAVDMSGGIFGGVGNFLKDATGFGDSDTFAKLWGGKLEDGTQVNGIGSTLINTGLGAWNAWNGMQQLDLAKEQFAFQKDAFNKQYNNQRKLTNARLRDRQNARLAAAPNGYQSTDAYMKQNGV